VLLVAGIYAEEEQVIAAIKSVIGRRRRADMNCCPVDPESASQA